MTCKTVDIYLQGRNFVIGAFLGGWMELIAWIVDDEKSSWKVLLGPLRDCSALKISDFVVFLTIIIAVGLVISAIAWLLFRNVSRASVFSFSAGVAWGMVGWFLNPDILCR